MSWALGEAVWSVYELGLGREVPFPSIADVGFLGLIPLAVAGMLAFPSSPRRLTSQVRTLFDGLVIAGSLLFISWGTVLGPTYREGSGSHLEKAIGLAYPIGDVAILSMVLFVAVRAGKGHRGALAFMGAGLAVLALADSGFIYQNLHETYASGSLIDPLWEIGFLLMMLGAVVAIPRGESAEEERAPRQLGVLLPYVAVIVVIVLAALWSQRGRLEPFLFWNMLAVLMLVVARQLMTLFDNLALTHNLERRVHDLVERDINERERVQREREELQMQLNHSRRLESLGHLAGAVAHDFNNILGIIIGFTGLTRSGLAPVLERLTEEQRAALERNLGQIERATTRAASLTKQLVTFSRRDPAQTRVVILNEIIRGIEQVLRQTLQEQVVLCLELSPELPAVKADPAQLEQVLTNLAVNARDAMPHGGTFTIATADEFVVADASGRPGIAPGRYVRMVVTDTGVGMSEEVAARAFDPFFTTKPKGSGTGLGLATVYGIVTQAGGSISIGSEPGRGTRFSIRFPASNLLPTLEPTEEVAPDALVAGGEVILVVEDNASMLELVCLTLSEQGYRVLRARNGVEALTVAERDGPIDAVVTDVVMPQMSGPDLIANLRRSRSDLPAVCMSGYAEPIVNPGDIGEGVRLIGKPFTPDQLLGLVREVLIKRPRVHARPRRTGRGRARRT